MSKLFLDNIFGKQEGNVKVGGLVDSTFTVNCDEKLRALEQLWNEREKLYCSKGDPQVYTHFKNLKVEVVQHYMKRFAWSL